VDPEAQAVPRAVTVDDLEEAARRVLPRTVYDYYAGGAGDEWTLRENRRSFERWVLRPRVLTDVSSVDPSTTVLGRPLPMPVLVAPMALQRLAHPNGELATARAARAAGVTMVLSTVASATIEEVAATGVPRWFQLYVHRDRDLTAELVKRAAEAGYEVLVVTVDAPMLGRRLRDERNRFTLPPGIGLANLAGVPLPEDAGSGLFRYFASQLDPSVTWDDVAWLRSLSELPVVLKGILTAEDALRAAEAGVAGVVVSNHGGRQLDGVPAALDVLPEVVAAVGSRLEVLMDGGVRRGTDVLKALALGARAVLLGRPVLWGLATGGEEGVRRVLDLLRGELVEAMALAGIPGTSAIDRSLVAPAPGVRAPSGPLA
jgi:4-hydroxymandelate oxidase